MTVRPKFLRKKKAAAAASRLLKFPEVKDKKLAGVEYSSRDEGHSIHLRFQDNTSLSFNIEPGFTLFASYADWKTGNERPIRRWSPLRSRLSRETV